MGAAPVVVTTNCPCPKLAVEPRATLVPEEPVPTSGTTKVLVPTSSVQPIVKVIAAGPGVAQATVLLTVQAISYIPKGELLQPPAEAGHIVVLAMRAVCPVREDE
jgi:hypothetical protein